MQEVGREGHATRGARALALAGALAVALSFGAAPAGASVTLGQLAPIPTSPDSGCPTGFEIAQTGVASGASYTVPGKGTITSWSHNAEGNANQMLTMKIYRKVTDPNIYTVVGHDGPHGLTAGELNTFAANIPVQTGDILGLDPASTGVECTGFTGNNSDTFLVRQPPPSNLADGASAQFTATMGSRLNITAVFTPSNAVTVGTTSFNKKKGTATLNLDLPNPGDLAGSGKGAKVASAGGAVISKAVGAGPAQLLVKAKGKQLKTLNATGKVKLSVTISYTPTNGAPGNQSVKVKLKKKV
jgi:hypothetical protein